MRYFLDTEFVESGRLHPVWLMSIGIVAEDGRELYLQNLNCTPLHHLFPEYSYDLSGIAKPNAWVIENVIPHLTDFSRFEEFHHDWINCEYLKTDWRFSDRIAAEIVAFVGDDPAPQFWGYYADYDWVVFCQLFGTMMDLPKGYLTCQTCEARHAMSYKGKGLTVNCVQCVSAQPAVIKGSFPMYCRDLKQWCDALGNPKLPEQTGAEHHALADARWNREAYEFLVGYERGLRQAELTARVEL